MSGAKPYVLLMNTDYDVFKPEWVERYFQQALFYGMWPSMFSHNASENPYWRNPKWYNRDRPLFKRYIPLIKLVAEAGWQPVTLAKCDNAHIQVERFGPDSAGRVFLTLFNSEKESQTGKVSIPSGHPWTPRAGHPLTDLVSQTALVPAPGGWEVRLESQQTAVIKLP